MKIFKIFLKVLVLICLFAWILLVLTDYFKVKNGKDPLFCLSEETKQYEDGSTHICNGLGYKTIRYNRTCLTATEFGPFIIQERTCE